MEKAGNFIIKVFAGLLIWMFVAGLAALTLWPSIPSSWKGWAVLVVFGPPAYLLAEGLGEMAWNSKPGRDLADHPSRPFRMFVMVVLGFVFVMIGVVVSN